jgi:hypothetical protein
VARPPFFILLLLVLRECPIACYGDESPGGVGHAHPRDTLQLAVGRFIRLMVSPSPLGTARIATGNQRGINGPPLKGVCRMNISEFEDMLTATLVTKRHFIISCKEVCYSSMITIAV